MSLTLIRHAAPQSDTTIPASDWRLSHAGRESCRALAERLRPLALDLIVSSVEPKAVETARLTAGYLGIPSEIAFSLHEHDRSNMGFIPDGERFQQMVADLFARPDERVFGRESANEALSRFEHSLHQLLTIYQGQNFGVVTHGTVLSLFVAKYNPDVDVFAFWKGLEMPDVIELAKDFKLRSGDD
jgi:broad specificity phosphatase PhoE